MKSLFEHTVEVRELLGGSTFLSPHGVVRLINHPTTRTYTLLVFVVLFTTDLSNLLFYFLFWTVVFIWVGALCVFFLVLIGQFLCIALIEQLWRVELRPFRTTLFVLAAFVSAFFSELMGLGLSGGANPVNSWPDLPIYVLMAEAFGQIYFRMILPPIINTMLIAPGNASTVDPNKAPGIQPHAPPPIEPAQKSHPPSLPVVHPLLNTPQAIVPVPTPSRNILIGSAPIPLAQLRLIEAREHHVHVTTKTDSMTHRARLSDIIAQTDTLDGIQPHRSWWVSAGAARSLTREGQRHVLHLDDGTQVPVARSRVDTVRRFLEDCKETQ
ncbi:MAG: LytTR family transcriptional regulator [Pelagimonas sp.]|nr:LytTR family transcriptional regulator [Pelagimonas sp.]